MGCKNHRMLPQPIGEHDLTCRHFQVIAGKIFAATLRSFSRFRTHHLDLTDVAQVGNRVSDAKLHSLGFGPIRHQSNGFPL